MFRLKQRTLGWLFNIAHLPGLSNLFPDAVSRLPSPNGGLSDGDIAEIALVGTIDKRSSMCDPILWNEVITESKSDSQLCRLAMAIQEGFPTKADDLHQELSPFWKIRNSLSVSQDVIWYNDRIVLPCSLR